MLLAGCGGVPPVVDDEGPRLALGGVTSGGDARLVSGAQGGFHVWLALRTAGMLPGVVRIRREGRRVGDGQTVLRWEGRLDIGAAGADGWWALPDPMPMFMCPTPIGLSVVDQPITLGVTLSDEEGHALATGDVTVTPRCPAEELDWCMRICTG
jgi:hypothetical protein